MAALNAMVAAASAIRDTGDLSVLAETSPFDRWLATG